MVKVSSYQYGQISTSGNLPIKKNLINSDFV